MHSTFHTSGSVHVLNTSAIPFHALLHSMLPPLAVLFLSSLSTLGYAHALAPPCLSQTPCILYFLCLACHHTQLLDSLILSQFWTDRPNTSHIWSHLVMFVWAGLDSCMLAIFSAPPTEVITEFLEHNICKITITMYLISHL